MPTLYKARGVPLKQKVCAICVERTRGRTRSVELGYGVSVWLCEGHASDAFRRQRAGRDFVLTLERLWSAHGCLTLPRRRALDAHLAALRPSRTRPTRRRPGSYAWPALRREAEAAFASGSPVRQTTMRLRALHARGAAVPPSSRTFRRWAHERRWLEPG
jgi:hypothetical protein